MYTYSVSEEDYLAYFLFNQSLKKKKGINKVRLILSIYFLLLGATCLFIEDYIIGIIFIAIGIIYFSSGKLYMKWAYKKAFKKAIQNDLKGQIDSPVTLAINDEKIVVTDQSGVFYYNLSAIETIREIPTHLFIKFTNSHIIIVPKIETGLTELIKSSIAENNLPHVEQLDWKN